MHTGISQRARLYICSLLMPVFLHRYIAKAKPSTIPQAIMSPYQTIFSPSIPKRFSVAYRFKSFYRAFGEFCQSRGIRKPNYKSFALLFPLRRLHRRNLPMAAGNFFYESALNLALLTAMLICCPHFRRKGYLLPFYMIGYGTIRFFVEGLLSIGHFLKASLCEPAFQAVFGHEKSPS